MSPKRAKPNGRKPAPVSKAKLESIRHKDKRANIPTRELQSFVKEDENKPKVVLYPRDPSLDPQLVWKGKDELDSKDLAIPAVPIYIQEKISPQVIIENLRATSSATSPATAPSLFADFNGIDFEKLINFYRHELNWSNRMILGDSLIVMNSLAEKEGLKGKVQMIYVDPPYGIKFGSNWQVSTRKRDLKNGKVEDASRQPEQIKAFRDTWELGIHSYLAYMRDRLVIARDLLTETGSIFVQIGEENVHMVRSLLDEVFGVENRINQIGFMKTAGLQSDFLATVNDYLLWYGKDRTHTKFRRLYSDKEVGGESASQYNWADFPDGSTRLLSESEIDDQSSLPNGTRIFSHQSGYTAGGATTTDFDFSWDGKVFSLPPGQRWRTTRDGMARLGVAGRFFILGNSLRYKRYLIDFPVFPITDLWKDTSISGFSEPRRYVVQTSPRVIERCLLMTTDSGDLVLDPTCGGGTTAFVAEQWGRRWITIDTSRVALALTRTRLMEAKFPYFLLADSPEGLKKEAELTGKIPPDYKTEGDIKRGFVYGRVPHVTLKSIANNPDIKPGISQRDIDVSIAKHADTELLYDRPYEDKKIVRVTGPFTVESLSPHRVVATDDERPVAEKMASETDGNGQFATMILENLKKAGVQNTVKNERLVFDRLDPYAGLYLHGAGEYTENGKTRRVAICIGPEHGTVGPELIKDAAKEAVKGVGFDLLVVCGFAFDPYVSEETKEYGKLTVLTAKMNPDLSMGDELLKKTGAANLFMVFGEPDIVIDKQKDGHLTLEIKGIDVYDPTTGQIRSHSTDDIACWFVDTDYNEESFFVRHAYFCGDDHPYEKLKRALRAEIDEAAWQTLYSTKSRPFPRPKKGKIAVKVINHYGDEVLKVYKV